MLSTNVVAFTLICIVLMSAAFLSGRDPREKQKNVAIALIVELLMFLVIFTNITDRIGWLITF
ncbi:hypothetical protein A3C37_01555 [Candidatus Peribacteria bacterium RIFCSPHIGHO2_02_FULL_53_20]|nr:MAG: hypothetical protein A3C37_01555 [Candidatus Peribacteria bacterium RIFCSPHIGHO2_02_FULL_53_20]OGJ67136.1 MAG: hypothetical protein A3B61_02780 [Candidatus Peribacteria bacterium RIFCSPLOWO2_01_FULL_53_10]OGJ75037.1 MAG: hypothetical protein A3G69_02035 [Candidatus Peribacteria bacterium RIFCSPLOWO2_12_FULL_53_10]